MDKKFYGLRLKPGYWELIQQFKQEENMEAWFYKMFEIWAKEEGLNPAFYEGMAAIHEAEAVRLKQIAIEAGSEAKKLDIVQTAIKKDEATTKLKVAVRLDRLIEFCLKVEPRLRRGWASSELRRTQIEENELSIDDFLDLVERASKGEVTS